ncbi:GSCOCG00007261001-RA-CDS [Cotesia congregata]|nr:GSCOCG00007261001-RA-CDS [Cotesia congregata]
MANNSFKFKESCNEIECSNYSCNCCKKNKDNKSSSAAAATAITTTNFSNLNDKMKNGLHMIEKRYSHLNERRQYLIEKIYNIEKTIPLLMVYNSSSSNDFSSFIDAISPVAHHDNQIKNDSNYLNNNDIKNSIKDLNDQVTQLYDEIIKIEIEYEESIMSLESLQAINLELENKLSNIGQKNKTPEIETLDNLYYIISQNNTDNDDDNNILNCLQKLKLLVKEEIRLKNCINLLEKREKCFNQQIDKLLFVPKNIAPCNKASQHCIGKNCHKRKDKKSMDNIESQSDDINNNKQDYNDDDIDIDKYCDCCPLSKKE